jgi:hypothetical protein
MDRVDIDERCGRYFTYRDFIECGPSWRRRKIENRPIDNRPLRDETYAAMRDLCSKVLDPVVDLFGPIKLTFGFVSSALDHEIRKVPPANTSRAGDQHAGCELNSRGNPYCRRLGMSYDFKAGRTGSKAIAAWIHDKTEFDRLYWYGNDRPIHVSVGPDNSRRLWSAPHSGGRRALFS